MNASAEAVDLVGLGISPEQAAEALVKDITTKVISADILPEPTYRDAMPRDVLLALVDDVITQHLPDDALSRLRAAEREQRASLEAFLAAWRHRGAGRR